MGIVHAIFEDGVFRTRGDVGIPNGSEVEFEPRIVRGADGNGDGGVLSNVYEILRRRFDSGEPDVSARQNEHQP